MALYAFDGTGNTDDGPEIEDTNVVRFRELYQGTNDVEYLDGVGTRMGAVGRIAGGLFGMGGRTRIDEMYDLLCDNYLTNNDKDIDIIGYSRGAALAVHFANKIAKEGVKGSPDAPKIRFLGVWDLVASFGLSFNNVIRFQEMNLFWDVKTVPAAVQACAHAMAYDERREAFNITRLNEDHANANVEERWFRGVHGDIGGGNRNTERSNIALQWMLQKAVEAGVPVKQPQNDARYCVLSSDTAPVSANRDVKIDARRAATDTDLYHTSFDATLAVGDSRECTVRAARKYNWSGITLEPNATYEVSIAPDQTWEDGNISCGPDGWETKQLPWFKEKFAQLLEDNRRAPKQRWFALMAASGDEDENAQYMGAGGLLEQVTEPTDLYFFANDLDSRYDNNEGQITVVVERTS